MGQRLTIQIFKNCLETDSLATIYYHWSAYSESALEELRDFNDAYKRYYNSESPDAEAVAALRAVLANGGNLSDEEDKVLNLYPELHNHVNSDMTTNRSNGLVAFTKDRQRELLSYSEGDIRLYLEDQTFDFGVYVEYDPEFDMEYFYDMLGENFKLEGLTDEEILDICARELPAIKLDGTHSVDDIESLLETFEQNIYFYDTDQEIVVGKTY